MKTLLIAALCVGALAQDKSGLASITGIVKVNGSPAASMSVTLMDESGTMRETLTDASGKFSFSDVRPGSALLNVKRNDGPIPMFRNVTLEPGQKLVHNFEFTETGTIWGRITDENKKPIKGIEVRAISAEYAYGAIRYTVATHSSTNENGDYQLNVPGSERPHYIVATNEFPYTGEPSNAPKDLEKRDHVWMPMYYPSARSIEEATPVTVEIGKRHEFVDFRMKSTPARCIEGLITLPTDNTAVSFDIGQNDPPLWTLSSKPWTMQHDPTGDGGRIRVCDLPPGHYWIKTYSIADTAHVHGMEFVTIGDHDVTGIVTGPRPQVQIEGTVMWDVPPQSDDPPKVELAVAITSTVGEFGSTTVPVAGALPRSFEISVSDHDAYVIAVSKIPDGAYLKDIVYAGRSVLRELLEPGATPDPQGLRIVLARDGARVSVKASGKDGQPLTGANIAVFPASATTEAAAASAMLFGQADAAGVWTSGLIAPGKYYVIATTSALNRTPDAFSKIWLRRSESLVVELGPNATTQVNRVPE